MVWKITNAFSLTIVNSHYFVVATKFQKCSDRAWSSRNRCLNGLRGNAGFWIDLDLWLRRCWRSNSLIVEVWCWRCTLLVVSGRRRSRMRRKFTGWCGRLWLGKLRRTGLSRLIGSNGVICCWCWRDMLPTLFASWRLCNLRASFDKSGLLALLGNRKRIMVVCVYYTSWKQQSTGNIFHLIGQAGLTSGYWFVASSGSGGVTWQ